MASLIDGQDLAFLQPNVEGWEYLHIGDDILSLTGFPLKLFVGLLSMSCDCALGRWWDAGVLLPSGNALYAF